MTEIQSQSFTFRFRRPKSLHPLHPSESLINALLALGKSEEMSSLVHEAQKTDKTVTIEVFQNRNGDPILIYFGKDSA